MSRIVQIIHFHLFHSNKTKKEIIKSIDEYVSNANVIKSNWKTYVEFIGMDNTMKNSKETMLDWIMIFAKTNNMNLGMCYFFEKRHLRNFIWHLVHDIDAENNCGNFMYPIIDCGIILKNLSDEQITRQFDNIFDRRISHLLAYKRNIINFYKL